MFVRSILTTVMISVLAPAYASDPQYAADVNGDGIVNILDLIAVRNSLNSCSFAADVNADGRVNILDLIVVRNALGFRLPKREYSFDFGSPTSPVAAGAIPVDPSTTYDAAAGYGWLENEDMSLLEAHDRQWEQPDSGDLISSNHPATFRIDLPAGTHEITVETGCTALVPSFYFDISGAQVYGSYYYGPYGIRTTASPSPDRNGRRLLDLVLRNEGPVDITLYSPTNDTWGICAIYIRPEIVDIVLHDVHLAPDRHYDYSPPTRDSNLAFVSERFGDYQQDWDFIADWVNEVVDDTMTDQQKVMAVINKIYTTLSLDSPHCFHPVDVITAGSAECEQRSILFQCCMATLGLPSRGMWFMFLPESRYPTQKLALDPLAYTQVFHSSAEVFYDGRWHYYNTTFGALYGVSIVELLAYPGTEPIMCLRPIDHLFYDDVKEVIFLMDMNQWRVSGSANEVVQYTTETARTLYSDSLQSYPFRLQARRPGYEPGEYLLPIVRYYRYHFNLQPLQLHAGEFIARDVFLSPLEGINRLSNQLNIKWPDGTETLRFLLSANGNQIEIPINVESPATDYAPIILGIPAGFLTAGNNTIGIQLLEPDVITIPYAFDRQDAGLVFQVPRQGTGLDFETLIPLPFHLFWNVDVVYKPATFRTSPDEIVLDFSGIPTIAKSAYMIPHGSPETILGSDTTRSFTPFTNWTYNGTRLHMDLIPACVKVKLQP